MFEMSTNFYSKNENAVICIFDWMNTTTEATWYTPRDDYMAANSFRAHVKSAIVLISLISRLHPHLYSRQSLHTAREKKFVVIAPGTYFSRLLTN